jgi:HEAT repeat protein
VTKFLRKARRDGSEAVERFVREAEDFLPADFKTADPRTVTEALLRRLEIIQNRAKKIKMLRAIVPFEAPWVPLVFLDLLADPSEEIRDLAVRELLGREDWTVSDLYSRLETPPWYAKSTRLRVLGLKKDAGAVSHIRGTLGDPNSEVKRTAAWALGEIGGTEARALLVRLARDANRYVRLAAEEALDSLCDFKFS